MKKRFIKLASEVAEYEVQLYFNVKFFGMNKEEAKTKLLLLLFSKLFEYRLSKETIENILNDFTESLDEEF